MSSRVTICAAHALFRIVPSLARIDHKMLLDRYISTHLEGTTDPRRYGRPLAGGLHGLWRYRIGDWRLVVKIIDDRVLILALEFERRDAVYKQ